MNQGEQAGHRLPAIVLWLLLAFMVLLAAAFLAMGFWVWQETKRVQVLQAEVQMLRNERLATETQLLGWQNSASALEDRIATLESNDPAQQIAALQAKVEMTSDSAQLNRLWSTLDVMQAQVDDFQADLDRLGARMNALELVDALPPEARLAVPTQQQSHNLSCESSAASMTAQYHGVNLSEADVLAALPLNDNPHLGFRGNVDGPTGGIQDYGVYAGPIAEVLNDHGLQAWTVTDGLEGIKAAIVRGNPVIAWVTYDCQPSTPTMTTIDGKSVSLVPWQHVVVVTGYNDEGVWANDPWDGKSEFYPVADFERAMGYFDDMAIEVARP